MSTKWLYDQLREKSNATLDGGNPILTVEFGDRTERVYCPDSDEYRVTAAVVEKAADLQATIIAYSQQWCGVTEEGKEYAKEVGVHVMPNRSFFAYLREKGGWFFQMVSWIRNQLIEIEADLKCAHLFGSALDPSKCPRDVDIILVTRSGAGSESWREAIDFCGPLSELFSQIFLLPLSVIIAIPSEWAELDGVIVRDRVSLL
jgi:hypothetical protein